MQGALILEISRSALKRTDPCVKALIPTFQEKVLLSYFGDLVDQLCVVVPEFP